MSKHPESAPDIGHVLPFRQKAAPPPAPADNDPAVPGLERYANQPDEYRHRMVVNVVAALFVIALAASGIWLINALADQRKSQECVLAGHRNCANVSVNGHIRY